MYKIYFYSEPIFLYIDSENILDLDLKVINEMKIFEMIYNDEYFDLNRVRTKSKSWSLIIQSFDENGKFILQSNLLGDRFKIKKLTKGNRIRLIYDQITNNKIWASIPPSFEEGEIAYKQGKLSYYRDLKLKNILSS